MDEIDIYRSAKLILDQYGSDAMTYAAKTANAMMARGNTEGFAVWKQIGRAIAKMRVAEGRTKH